MSKSENAKFHKGSSSHGRARQTSLPCRATRTLYGQNPPFSHKYLHPASQRQNLSSLERFVFTSEISQSIIEGDGGGEYALTRNLSTPQFPHVQIAWGSVHHARWASMNTICRDCRSRGTKGGIVSWRLAMKGSTKRLRIILCDMVVMRSTVIGGPKFPAHLAPASLA